MAVSTMSPGSADSLLDFATVDPDRDVGARPEPWRVLIVDDDEDVHVATELAMRDVTIEGRLLSFLHAASAREAKDLITADPNIAVVLLDVVMETPDAGLRLVRQIREDMGRSALRIVLRTGQPGYAPEIETLRTYDINDYRTKSELTRVRLFSSLTAAIRSYSQLIQVIGQRDELARLNAQLRLARDAERTAAERRLAAETALNQAHLSMERCIEQRTRELSQAVTELDAFNRMVSHDLSGPLHGLADLSGMIRAALDRGDPAKVQRWLGMMETQTRRLAQLVVELLGLARVSQGTLKRERVALNALVEDSLQILALTQGRDRLSAISVGPLPVLDVDAGLLRQVFVNLLSNALKFTRETSVPQIEVTAEQLGADWAVTVRDNGAGFEPHQASALFKPFSRLHPARFEGSGVGLTIVQRVIERHGGRIQAEGRPGAGATFRFTLPVSS